MVTVVLTDHIKKHTENILKTLRILWGNILKI